jgi:prophage DNA circulation protein
MSWNINLQDCQFRGVRFDCISTNDESSRALVEHAYPYRDGAEVEDLGANAWKATVKTLIYGADYETQLKLLIAALNTAGSGEFVHPIFGRMQVQVASYRPVHDAESPDQAQVEISFVETAPHNPFFDLTLKQAEIAAVGTAVDSTTALLADDYARKVSAITTEGKVARIEAMRAQVEQTLAQFRSMVNGVQSSGLDLMATPAVLITDLTACVQAVQLLAFAAVASIQSFDNVKVSLTKAVQPVVETAPSYSINLSDNALVALQAQSVAALALADAAGVVFAQEQQTPTATPMQLESIAAVARTNLQAVITTLRTLSPLDNQTLIESFKNVAATVQVALRAALLARPPMIQRAVEFDTCLRLLAHHWYADHTRATELLRLNNLPYPNFVTKGTMLYAYAQ